MADKHIVLMAGGTGGHVFPALSVAEVLRREGCSLAWLGTRRGIESRLVPEANIAINYLAVEGLRGKGKLSLLLAPFKLSKAVWQALAVLKREKPAAVVGFGGFASGPGALAARLLGIPLIIHEQNAVAGTTNKLSARWAVRRLCAFPHALPEAEQVGNPVRESIAALPDPAERWQDREGKLRLLVLGGSLGAKAINDLLPKALKNLSVEERPDVRHQCGKAHAQACSAAYLEAQVDARVEPFIADMSEAYGWADVVICRAGALTVAELSAAGVGSLLIPFPYAIDDHQTANARYLSDNKAGLLVQQSELDETVLTKLLRELFSSRQQLLVRAQCARQLARPDAAERVANIVLEQANG